MKVPEYKKRIKLLKYMYYALRLLDDICDGDTLHNFPVKERKKIIEGRGGIGLYDILIEKVRFIANELGVLDGINFSISEIVGSFIFDIDRIIDPNKTRKREELKYNFHRMDIVGTEFGTAIIFGLNPRDTLMKLGGLGEASRKSFNIDDLKEDIIEGLINIPFEDLQGLGIIKSDLDNLKLGKISDSINEWINQEIRSIKKLLGEYNNIFSFINLLMGKGIKLSFSTNYFRKLFNNLLLKYVVLPKGYINEINSVISKNIK